MNISKSYNSEVHRTDVGENGACLPCTSCWVCVCTVWCPSSDSALVRTQQGWCFKRVRMSVITNGRCSMCTVKNLFLLYGVWCSVNFAYYKITLPLFIHLAVFSCNGSQAFDIAEKEFGIEPILSGYEMTSREIIDKTAMLSYLSQFYELFRKQSVERDAGKYYGCCHYCLLDLGFNGRIKKCKGFPYWLPSIGPRADPGVQAVSPQVTISHPPSGKLPLLSARLVVTFPAAEHHRPLASTKLYCLVT